MGGESSRPADSADSADGTAAPTAAAAADDYDIDSSSGSVGGDDGGGDGSGLMIAMVAVLLVLGLVAVGVRWQRRGHDGARRAGAGHPPTRGGRGGDDTNRPTAFVFNPVYPASSQHGQAPHPGSSVDTGLAAPAFFGVLLGKQLDKAAPPAGHASPAPAYATGPSTGRAHPTGNSETYDHLGDRPVQYSVPPGKTGHGGARAPDAPIGQPATAAAAAADRASAAAPPAEYAAIAPTYVTGSSAVGNGPSYDRLGDRPATADAGRVPVYKTGNTAVGTAGPAPAGYSEAVGVPVYAEYADADAEGVPVYAVYAEPGLDAGMTPEDGGHVYTEVKSTPVYDECNDAPTLGTLKTLENGYVAMAGADEDEELC